MLNSIIFLGGLVSAFGLGAISPNQVKQNDDIFRLENHKLVIYNDDDYEIEFSVDELNTYQWNNFASYVSVSDYIGDTSIHYNDLTFDFSEDDGEVIRWSYSEGNYIDFDYFTSKEFSLGVNSEEVSFEYGFLFMIDDNNTAYLDIKQAIELDIQANQPNPGVAGVMVQFVSILTDGIVSLGSGVANGVVAMATALFLEVDDGVVTGLSVFGGILAIFAGLALAVGITSKVYQWVTSLGN